MSRGVYAGALLCALLLLILAPLGGVAYLPAMLLGPLAGVWLLVNRRQIRLDGTRSARLGFYSAFYGALAAIAISQVAHQVLQDELWRFENLYLLPPLVADLGMDTDSPGGWYFWMLQLTVIAIAAGALGAPAGLLWNRLLTGKSSTLED